jgi:hypothetical protein
VRLRVMALKRIIPIGQLRRSASRASCLMLLHHGVPGIHCLPGATSRDAAAVSGTRPAAARTLWKRIAWPSGRAGCLHPLGGCARRGVASGRPQAWPGIESRDPGPRAPSLVSARAPRDKQKHKTGRTSQNKAREAEGCAAAGRCGGCHAARSGRIRRAHVTPGSGGATTGTRARGCAARDDDGAGRGACGAGSPQPRAELAGQLTLPCGDGRRVPPCVRRFEGSGTSRAIDYRSSPEVIDGTRVGAARARTMDAAARRKNEQGRTRSPFLGMLARTEARFCTERLRRHAHRPA